MNILGTQYSLTTKSIDIYLAGCRGPHCENCHNPESWDFEAGVPYSEAAFHCDLQAKLDAAGSMVRHIMVMGGEPLDQPTAELYRFLTSLHQYGRRIWLFTRRERAEVPVSIQVRCDYIKTGPYIPGRPSVRHGKLTLASDNQKIHCFIPPDVE